MAQGGYREGAGRPKGSTNLPNIRNYITEEQITEFVAHLMEKYKEDSRLEVWLGNQIFGMARQSVDHTTLGKEMPQPILNVYEDNSNKEDSEADKTD